MTRFVGRKGCSSEKGAITIIACDVGPPSSLLGGDSPAIIIIAHH